MRAGATIRPQRPPCVKVAVSGADWGLDNPSAPAGTGEAFALSLQHVLNENTISGGGVVHKNMGNGTDELAFLGD